MREKLRSSGIDLLEMCTGVHSFNLCHMKADLAYTPVLFFKTGLENYGF